MARVRVLVVDDHPVFRVGLRALLSSEPDFELVGEAVAGDEALRAVEALDPDVVLMDLNLPRLNGIEATREITRLRPAIAVLVVTMLDDDSVYAAMRAGARGYVLKGAEPEELLRAIHAVSHGEAIFSPGVARKVLASWSRPSNAFPDLSEREREVLDLIARGLTNSAIAEQLSIAPKTVRNHISNIFSKLQVVHRGEAIVRAREAGLGRYST